MTPSSSFSPVLDDPVVKPNITRLVFLSGKLYYDLAKHRASLPSSSSDRVAFIRVEELSPFPASELRSVIASYANAQEFVWVQEEPRNQGAFSHVRERLDALVKETNAKGELVFRGRKADAVPAPGSSKRYQAEQKEVIASIFEGL